MPLVSGSSAFTNPQGVAISPGLAFWLNFAPVSATPPKPPNIGAHVGVVTNVRPPYAALVYGQRNQGPGNAHRIDPGSAEAHGLEPWLKSITYFRDDSVVIVHQSVFGNQVGRVTMITLAALRAVEQAALTAQTVIDLREFVPAVPAPPAR